MPESHDEFNVFCDSIALIYHESRNVRHLVHKNLLKREAWRFVVSLPTNRDDAWREIAPLKDKARQTLSVDKALKVFESRFRLSLLDLAEMFTNENWKHEKLYGGNAWAIIANLALQLADAMRRKDGAAAHNIATQLKDARHNTGSVHLFRPISILLRRNSEIGRFWRPRGGTRL